MNVLVPLAGPDFLLSDGTTKAEQLVNGQPLLRWVLDNREWIKSGTVSPADMVFILLDHPVTRAFSAGPLATWYPNAKSVFLGSYTKGAALSALAGLATLPNFHNIPVCVDLADIYYQAQPRKLLFSENDPHLGGIALSFESKNPQYSYLRVNNVGAVVEAKEKSQISNTASAGTYFFRNGIVYLGALQHTLFHAGEFEFNGLQYVCPLFNGVLAQGLEVGLEMVTDVMDIKVV